MAESHEEHGHHIASNALLNKTFIQLFLAMVLTIAAARAPFEGVQYFPGLADFMHQYQNLWWLTNAIALGIAFFKAVQVVRFFMGAQFAGKVSQVFAVGGFIGFTLLFILFWDYVGRPWEPVKGWERVPTTAMPRNPDSDAGVPFKVYEGNEGGHGKAAEPATEH